MEDDEIRRLTRRRPMTLRSKFNSVICLVVVIVSLMTIFLPVSIWILEVTLWFFIPWMIANMVMEQRKIRQLKRESRQLQREYEAIKGRLEKEEQ